MIWIDAFNLWKSIYLLVESVINWEIAKNSQLNTPTACFFFFSGADSEYGSDIWRLHQLIYSTTNKKWGCCCCTNQCIATSWFCVFQEIYWMVCRGWSSNPRWWCYFFPQDVFEIIRINAHCFAEMERLHGWPSMFPIRSTLENWTAMAAPKSRVGFSMFFRWFSGFRFVFFGRIFCGSKASRENFPGVYGMGNCSNKLAEPWLDQCNLHARKERQQKPMAGGVVGQSCPRLLQVGGSKLGEGLGWW